MRLPLFALLLCCVLPAPAADWLTVTKDRVRSVEIDRASIMAAENGSKVAWGRIVLSDEQAKVYGYRSVRALNRYDCRSHSFVIVKRVYLASDESILREERVDNQAPIGVQRGTVDDRFFSEVCKPATMENLRDTARQAADALARAQEDGRPALRRADIRLAREDNPAAAPAAPSAPLAEPRAQTRSSARATPAPEARPTPPATREAARAGLTRSSPGNVSLSPDMQGALERARAARQSSSSASVSSSMSASSQASSVSSAPAHAPHWAYEGEYGPEHWGKLPGNATCATGLRQSPIDIRDGIRVEQEAIEFNYRPSQFRIVDNGYTIQVDYGADSRISLLGRSYELLQFHFHLPAEERINGRGFAMGAHLVHRDPEGRLAIIAILLEPGEANPFIQTLWNNLPLEKHEAFTPRTSIDISRLLPARRDYFSYMGSLTTPPCTEGVLWIVFKDPVTLSPEQIEVFRRFYRNNARPVQPINGRIIKESR